MKSDLLYRYVLATSIILVPLEQVSAQFFKADKPDMAYNAIPHATSELLILQDDDDSAETNFGVPIPNAEYIWFTEHDVSGEDFPLEITSLSVYTFNTNCENEFVDLYLYEDQDGSPLNGANPICEAKGVMTRFAFFSEAGATEIGSSNPCCVAQTQTLLVASVNRTCQGVNMQAAALDRSSSAGNSYFRTTSGLREADPPILNSSSGLNRIDDVGLAGNWMLRAAGITASTTCAAILPVELSLFQAEVNGAQVTLAWSTESEVNNSGFEVELKTDSGFKTLGFIQGYGTTTEEQSYRYDVGDLLPGSHIFRLKQIDFDGSIDYSSELEAIVTLPDGYVISDAYPNPFNPSTTIKIGVKKNQNVRLEIYNSLGQLVHVAFDGRIGAEQMKSISIDLDGMTSGQYILAVNGNGWEDHRVVTLAK